MKISSQTGFSPVPQFVKKPVLTQQPEGQQKTTPQSAKQNAEKRYSPNEMSNAILATTLSAIVVGTLIYGKGGKTLVNLAKKNKNLKNEREILQQVLEKSSDKIRTLESEIRQTQEKLSNILEGDLTPQSLREDVYNKYPYDVNQMAELIRMGYSSKDIEEVRAYNRAESGITQEEEKAAQLCLDRSRFKSELLVVKNLPHERFEAIIDRAFWMQRVQNVVIFTELGSVLYAGFADIAQGAFDRFHGSLSYCFWEGSWKTEEEQERIIQFLFEKTKEKDQDDLFY